MYKKYLKLWEETRCNSIDDDVEICATIVQKMFRSMFEIKTVVKLWWLALNMLEAWKFS